MSGFMRMAEIEIDLNNLKSNLIGIRKKIGVSVRIIGIVKTNAYGHGVIPVSKTLIKSGVSMLGVATLEEALQIRENHIKIPLLVLTPGFPEQSEHIIKNNIRQCICTLEMAKALSISAVKHNKKAIVHIKIDTGMGRLGVMAEEVVEFIKKLRGLKNMEIEGVFSHLATSDDKDKRYARQQIKRFNNVIELLEKENINVPLKHIANSGAILDMPESYKGHFNMVRPGLMLYGMYPSVSVSRSIKLKPVLCLRTKVIFIKNLPKGSSVSYGRTFTTKRGTKIAVLGIGYGDGYNRLLSNRAEAIINGRKVSVVGRVCMDMLVCDITGMKNVKIGDEAVLIGTKGKQKILAEELAKKISTIPYEITCNLSQSIRRDYIS